MLYTIYTYIYILFVRKKYKIKFCMPHEYEHILHISRLKNIQFYSIKQKNTQKLAYVQKM